MKTMYIFFKHRRQEDLLETIYLRVRNVIPLLKDHLAIIKMRFRRRKISPRRASNLIVCLTSFPARIDHAWVAIESIFLQDFLPSKIVLVLSEEEFPSHDLPKSINTLIGRGLEIIWTPKNIRSYQKLLPVRERYPDATIITVDDDVLYEQWRVRKLVEASQRAPNSIIGHRGWEITKDRAGLTPYVTWPAATPKTSSNQVFLTGVGGILYPPSALPLWLLLDIKLALSLCPVADDVWFWAVARKAGVECLCLGNHNLTQVKSLKKSPALHKLNWKEGMNDKQIGSVIKNLNLKI